MAPTPARLTATTLRDGPLFRSNARYYEPAGAVSWDVSMKATRPDWRISLKQGDTVSISATYDVSKASWYESMGILPLAWTRADDPLAKDPFDDAAEVRAMYESGGILTHGRLPENIDKKARKNLKLPDPRKLRSARARCPGRPRHRQLRLLARAATRRSAASRRRLMRPPLVNPGRRHLHQHRRARLDAAERAGLAQHHLLQGAL